MGISRWKIKHFCKAGVGVYPSQNVPLFLFSPVSITVKICSIGLCARTCWGYCSCVHGGEGKVFSARCPHLTVLPDGVPSWALVPGAINALPPGCCLGPPRVVAVQLLWCGSAGGISDTDPWSKARPVCAVQG